MTDTVTVAGVVVTATASMTQALEEVWAKHASIHVVASTSIAGAASVPTSVPATVTTVVAHLSLLQEIKNFASKIEQDIANLLGFSHPAVAVSVPASVQAPPPIVVATSV